jgi:hypothetical protein
MGVPPCLPASRLQVLAERDPEDPWVRAVELAQRGRMILDVAEADLAAAEAALGPFHETTWHFRTARDEARRSWDRLRAELGTRGLEAALAEPPLALLRLAHGTVLVPIVGRTYRVQPVAGAELAPIQFRLTRLPPSPDGPYYVCRLRDGTTQCDCAEWTYEVADVPNAPPCKHIRALLALGWL